MFIEIEPDTYLISNTFSDYAPGRVEVTPEQARTIATSKYGHAQFMYMDGNLIESPDATSEIETARIRAKTSLPRMELMLALESAGLLQQVTDFVAASTDNRIKIMWNEATSFNRVHPELLSMADQMGLTDAQIDAVFGI